MSGNLSVQLTGVAIILLSADALYVLSILVVTILNPEILLLNSGSPLWELPGEVDLVEAEIQ